VWEEHYTTSYSSPEVTKTNLMREIHRATLSHPIRIRYSKKKFYNSMRVMLLMAACSSLDAKLGLFVCYQATSLGQNGHLAVLPNAPVFNLIQEKSNSLLEKEMLLKNCLKKIA